MFQRDVLVSALSHLDASRRSLFAIITAERLAPFFRHYATSRPNDVRVFEAALDYAWSKVRSAETEMTDTEQSEKQSSLLEELLPLEDDPATFAPQAGDAVAALMYAIRSLIDPASEDAAWAAQRAYDAVDTIVNRLPDASGNAPEHYVDSHPLLDNELLQQQNDLNIVKTAEVDELSAIRARAVDVGQKLFAKSNA